eukprot:CAMPEP_0205803672 /NCGR_PEP_ID=MMETSP0205-20121125/6403_1 /ASSEMBLY_ACC=CAM_ASM_000278 /TAXON_ID=36767 /ORGANISM="Euplotes focardii, Strain TN1" /LENGTH=108 /DNA_ID=CAMNT_0053072139 /DNA_START=1320 /DNA_END=1643 /DNA_ORIENTATION=+
MSLELLKDQIDNKNRKFFKILSSSCSILNSLVEDILDHSKIETGVFEIEETCFKFKDLFDEVNDIFEFQAEKKNIGLNFQIDETIHDLSVGSDKKRLKQVMLNLISNS